VFSLRVEHDFAGGHLRGRDAEIGQVLADECRGSRRRCIGSRLILVDADRDRPVGRANEVVRLETIDPFDQVLDVGCLPDERVGELRRG
jgi:hypothetical protein